MNIITYDINFAPGGRLSGPFLSHGWSTYSGGNFFLGCEKIPFVMLIDKILNRCPSLSFGGYDQLLEDTIVFFINESGENFTRDILEKLNDNFLSDSVYYLPFDQIFLPSHLPYDNMFLQFSDGMGFWCVQNPEKDGFKTISGVALNIKSLQNKWMETGFVETYLHFFNKPEKIINNNSMFYIYYGKLYHMDELDTNPDMPVKGTPVTQIHALGKIVMLKRFLDILACKNIRTTKVEINARLQKKRRKKGKLPLVSYHVLQLKQSSSGSNEEKKDLWTNRVHLCRGHYKEYTLDKPLFGKLIGKYWWSPHARGNKQKGMVVKDYSIPEKED